jgi:hypothetical protein
VESLGSAMQFNLVGRLLAVLAACSVSSGCAFVPDLEPESSFSYAEIMTQLQCELYLASERLRYETNADPDTYGSFEPGKWIATIGLVPDLSVDASANIVGTVNSSLGKAFSKWTSGGGVASATGAEINGDANANNQYNFQLVNLYLAQDMLSPKLESSEDRHVFPVAKPTSEKATQIIYEKPDNLGVSQYKVVEEKEKEGKSTFYVVNDDTSPLNNHRLINPRLRNQCKFSEAAEKSLGFKNHISISTGDYPSEIGGVFGLYEFMNRSLAATRAGTTDVTQLQMEKWYKMNISAGVTPGWYVPYGNLGPAVGAVQRVNDRIDVTLKPASDPKPTLQYVCVVSKAKRLVCPGDRLVSSKQVAGPGKSKIPNAVDSNPVSDYDKQIMLQNSILQGIQSKLPGQ